MVILKDFPLIVHCLGTSTRWEPSPGYKWSYGTPINGLMNGSLQLEPKQVESFYLAFNW